MRVLGIETSCDETALAIFDGEQGLLGHVLHSQVDTHAQYGGVVPELASRDHINKIIPLLTKLLSQSSVSLASLDAIAYTAGPGLIGALLVGACCAKALGYSLQIPALPIHHMEGHLLAALLEKPTPDFPFIALLVSGGHTLLVEVGGIGKYRILGESIDDAAGEAFDKTAKLLGLSYPGGPALAKLAEKGNPNRFHFPRPLTDRPGLDFSFSGLKTAAMNTWKATAQLEADRNDVACAFQEAVVDTLFIKCQRALKQTGLTRLVVAGGVSANTLLRSKLTELEPLAGAQIFYPRVEFCTDNGAMIAFAGYHRFKAKQFEAVSFSQNPEENKTMESVNDFAASLKIAVRPRWPMDTIDPVERIN